MDIFVCLSIYIFLTHSCLSVGLPPVCLSSRLASSLSCPSAFIRVCLVLFESALYTSGVRRGWWWGEEGGVSIVLTRSVKTHPSLPLLCPWVPPPPSLPFPLLPAVTQCRLSAQFSYLSLITSWIRKTQQTPTIVCHSSDDSDPPDQHPANMHQLHKDSLHFCECQSS